MLTFISIIAIIILLIILIFFFKVLLIYFRQQKLKRISKVYFIKYQESDKLGAVNITVSYRGFSNSWKIDMICKNEEDEDIWDDLNDWEKASINYFLNSFFNNIRKENNLSY